MTLLKWLSGNDTGSSSKAIALTALGEMPDWPNYPHDRDDFGRCFRLLAKCPEAKAGLERLGKHGGPVWEALVPAWSEIEKRYLRDLDRNQKGDCNYDEYECYAFMQSIIRPAEKILYASAEDA